ncbi:hypothetical protein [Tritonibacter scottomollicae]|uniref:hypothetical protein n=1 Tax=Tritonibacter scottomollicae TaxID=483013 RepID=UPI003AA8C7A6
MTDLISIPQSPSEAAVAAPVDALAVLDEAWAYYTPEAPVVTREIEAQDAVFAYYEAA